MNERILKFYLATRLDTTLVTQESIILKHFLHHNKDTQNTAATKSPMDADIIVLFQDWSFKLPKYAKQLISDSFFRKYSKKIYVVNSDDTVREGFLPGCYVSLRKSVFNPQYFVPCAYPQSYNEFTQSRPTPIVKKEYLFSFVGNQNSHEIRSIMFKNLKSASDVLLQDVSIEFHHHNPLDKNNYSESISLSQFVLCPRGYSPATYRLFEAMSLGVCPVIISDEWVEIPGPNWKNCSIRVAEDQVWNIENILRARSHESSELGKRALQEWQKYFSEKTIYKAYLNNIINLYNSEEIVTRSIVDYTKYWKSYDFLRANNWTLRQKVKRKLKSIAQT